MGKKDRKEKQKQDKAAAVKKSKEKRHNQGLWIGHYISAMKGGESDEQQQQQ